MALTIGHPKTCGPEPRYPLLEVLLADRGRPLQAMYTYRDVAQIFECSVRTIQERVRRGELKVRDLPGRGRFLAIDLEDFILNSAKPCRK